VELTEELLEDMVCISVVDVFMKLERKLDFIDMINDNLIKSKMNRRGEIK
jgi:hypothetical protein